MFFISSENGQPYRDFFSVSLKESVLLIIGAVARFLLNFFSCTKLYCPRITPAFMPAFQRALPDYPFTEQLKTQR